MVLGGDIAFRSEELQDVMHDNKSVIYFFV